MQDEKQRLENEQTIKKLLNVANQVSPENKSENREFSMFINPSREQESAEKTLFDNQLIEH